MVNQRKFDPQSPLQEGEFRRINGIAETTEKALHEAGIVTFEELSILPPEEIASKLKGVRVLERIIQNDWTGQAAEFARQLAEARLPAEKNEPVSRQHYESFMVVLLIDEEYEVRRTKISHVQKGLEANWAGWDEPRLVNWIAAQSRLAGKQTPVAVSIAAKENAAAEEAAGAKEQVIAEEQPAAVEQPEAKAQPEAKELAETQELKPGQPRDVKSQKLDGTLQLNKLQIVAPVSKRVRQTVCPGDRFAVRFRLDFSKVELPQPADLKYTAEIQIHSANGWKQAYQSLIEGNISPDEDLPYIEVLVPGLPEGMYHLEGAVQIYPSGNADSGQAGLFAISEGILLRVTWEEPQPAITERGEKSPTGFAGIPK